MWRNKRKEESLTTVLGVHIFSDLSPSDRANAGGDSSCRYLPLFLLHHRRSSLHRRHTTLEWLQQAPEMASLAIPERIGQGQSLISLLEASAYDPDADFSDSEDEDSSDEPSPHSSDPELPSSGQHVYEPGTKAHDANPARGSQISLSSQDDPERTNRLVREREDLIKELTLDSIEQCVAGRAGGRPRADGEAGS